MLVDSCASVRLGRFPAVWPASLSSLGMLGRFLWPLLRLKDTSFPGQLKERNLAKATDALLCTKERARPVATPNSPRHHSADDFPTNRQQKALSDMNTT